MSESVQQLVASAQTRLAEVRGKRLPDSEIEAVALQLAADLFRLTRALELPEERRRQARLGSLLADDRGFLLLTLITDRAPRAASSVRLTTGLQQLVRRLGISRRLPTLDRLQLRALTLFGAAAPALVRWGITRHLRAETRPYILPGEPSRLSHQAHARRQGGTRLNINLLGEAILGDEEAQRHARAYLALLEHGSVDTVSIKISSLSSHLPLLAWESCVRQLSQRLRPLYRAALPRRDRAAKLVYLDMEAYRDLQLTRELFTRLLSEPEFENLTAGLALQAYLPESFALQRELTAWSRQRVADGGAPIRLRIVKGANLAAERVEAALHGHVLPIYASKAEVDANFKRMLEYGCAHTDGVRLGIASHNLFDIAYGMVLRCMHEAEDRVEFELLQGMANPLSRAVLKVAGNVLLYAPAVPEEHFVSAIAYLVRRLDENAGKENFLNRSLGMQLGDAAWNGEANKFRAALSHRHHVASSARRSQRDDAGASIRDGFSTDNSQLAASDSNESTILAHAFKNEPDTDFTQSDQRHWLWETIATCPHELSEPIPLTIAGLDRTANTWADGFDPSRPDALPYRYALATHTDVDDCLRAATSAWGPWASRPASERTAL